MSTSVVDVQPSVVEKGEQYWYEYWRNRYGSDSFRYTTNCPAIDSNERGEIQPCLLKYLPSHFSREAIGAEFEGEVKIEISISNTGEVLNVDVLKSSGRMDMDISVIVSARKYVFRPAYRDGIPVASKRRTTVSFKLANRQPD